MTKQHR